MRRHSILNEFIRTLFSRKYLKMWIIFAVSLTALLVIVFLGGSKKVTPDETFFYKKDTIVVGVNAGIDKFTKTDKSEGVSGFDCELITEILNRIYPDKKIQLVSIDSQMASYMLKNREIDLAIGGFVSGVIKTQGLSLSSGYYSDGVYAFVPPKSSMNSLSQIQGQTVLATTTEFTKVLLKNALEQEKLEVELVSCASYPDGIASVMRGDYAAILALKYKMAAYGEQLKRISPKLMNMEYRIMAWTDNANVMPLINAEILQMQQQGDIDTLLGKWNIDKQD